FVNTARNFDLIFFDLVRAGATKRNGPGRSMERFFKRDQNIRFDISATLSGGFAAAESAEGGTPASAAEKRFEEIAEAGAAEFELHAAAAVTAPLMKTALGLLSPLRRRLKSAGLVPVRAELVV